MMCKHAMIPKRTTGSSAEEKCLHPPPAGSRRFALHVAKHVFQSTGALACFGTRFTNLPVQVVGAFGP